MDYSNLVLQLATEGLLDAFHCGAAHDFWKFLVENPLNYGDFLEIHFCNADPIDIEVEISKVSEIKSDFVYRMFIFKTKERTQVKIPMVFSDESIDPDLNDGEKSFFQEFKEGLQKFLVTKKNLKGRNNCYDLNRTSEMDELLRYNQSQN